MRRMQWLCGIGGAGVGCVRPVGCGRVLHRGMVGVGLRLGLGLGLGLGLRLGLGVGLGGGCGGRIHADAADENRQGKAKRNQARGVLCKPCHCIAA